MGEAGRERERERLLSRSLRQPLMEESERVRNVESAWSASLNADLRRWGTPPRPDEIASEPRKPRDLWNSLVYFCPLFSNRRYIRLDLARERAIRRRPDSPRS